MEREREVEPPGAPGQQPENSASQQPEASLKQDDEEQQEEQAEEQRRQPARSALPSRLALPAESPVLLLTGQVGAPVSA